MALMKNVAKLSTEHFTYDGKTGTFICEVSNLNGLIRPYTTQIWDDACDEGFVLVSERTGAEVIVTNTGPARDKEGDITHWDFFPHRNDSFKKVVIFND